MSDIPHETIIHVGRSVVCDACGEDWTERKESGGFLFLSKAYCPDCTKRHLKTIKHYNEERFIRAWCPANQSYADWVRELRGSDDRVRIITGVKL